MLDSEYMIPCSISDQMLQLFVLEWQPQWERPLVQERMEKEGAKTFPSDDSSTTKGAQGQASDIEITAREIQKLKKELYEIIAIIEAII